MIIWNSSCFLAKIFDDTFLFAHNHVSKRSVEAHVEAHNAIKEHKHVQWTEQQQVIKVILHYSIFKREDFILD